MHFAGVLPADAPDPRDEHAAFLRSLPFHPYGLVPQATIEDHDSLGFGRMEDARGLAQVSVSVNYTLWRHPEDRDDPRNLAALDAATRAALDTEPPWPRPAWLVEQVQRMRYPMLSEAVRTTWDRESSEYTTLSYHLVHHANHILMNRFRGELGLRPGPRDPRGGEPWRVRESAIAPGVLDVDDAAVAASVIDTDPWVYAIGARLAPDRVVTVVVPRDDLAHLRIAVATRG